MTSGKTNAILFMLSLYGIFSRLFCNDHFPGLDKIVALHLHNI